MRRITAKPLDASVFAPFGQVLDLKLTDCALRQDHVARLINARPHARANLLLASAEPITLPLAVKQLERHPESSQLFLPLRVARYLIVVCPTAPDDGQDLDHLQAFVATGEQGVNYDPGVWHHGLTVLNRNGNFAVLFWEDGGELDTQVQAVARALEVNL